MKRKVEENSTLSSIPNIVQYEAKEQNFNQAFLIHYYNCNFENKIQKFLKNQQAKLITRTILSLNWDRYS